MQLDPVGLPSTVEADVLILGAGIAGCVAALRCAQLGLRPLVVVRSGDLMMSSSAWAQGGIIYEGHRDSPELLAKDIRDAGAGQCFDPAVDLLAAEGPRRVREFLLSKNESPVPFDRAPNGDLDRTDEAAHSVPRIIHVGDQTGRSIQEVLVDRVRSHPKIDILTHATAVDLLTTTRHGRDVVSHYTPSTCLGAYILTHGDGQVRTILARETILATGGLGQLYLHTTNPRGARGDGIAMAERAGASLLNLEYVQFHPTALYTETGPRSLITEALRGEGARLVRADGTPFMKNYDPRGELAPRDIVARAIHEEMLQNNVPCVYLDITHRDADWVRERFPHINATCLAVNIDMTKQPIPVVPAAHYSCGGVLVDLDGRTNVPRLWAIGEVSCTGVHGANRLASTSLLEGLVWAARASEAIARRLADRPDASPYYPVSPWVMSSERSDPALIRQDWRHIQYTMWNYVGLVRSFRRLKRARRLLRELELEIAGFYEDTQLTDDLIGLRNGVQAARLITAAALANRQSIGCHYRVD